MKNRILLVEDDANLGFVIRDSLEIAGYSVDLQENGQKALAAFQESVYELCILDVMLPAMDGFSLAEKIRETDQSIPILFLTARSLKADRLNGFRVGGDDYITKPFAMEELLSRIQVFLKRRKIENHVPSVSWYDPGNLTILGRDTIQLTQREADLLEFLLDRANQISKRSEILEKVWGEDDYFMGRSLDVFISRLRKYLKDVPGVELVNCHGVGFRLQLDH